jgi:hypothetical protein
MIEAPILAAMITASATLLSKAVDWIGKSKGGASDAQKVVDKVYDQLREEFTDGCVQVLKILEAGQLKRASQVRAAFYPKLTEPAGAIEALNSEFRYRLEFLRHCGVLARISGVEYGITAVGLAFLAEARKQHHYDDVLHKS